MGNLGMTHITIEFSIDTFYSQKKSAQRHECPILQKRVELRVKLHVDQKKLRMTHERIEGGQKVGSQSHYLKSCCIWFI